MKSSRPARVAYSLVVFLAYLCGLPSVWAAEESGEPRAGKDKTNFVRVRRSDEGEPIALEVAVVRYETPEGKAPKLAVDLIGAVHIGEKSYYEKLNELFTSYDAVLYELVAVEGTRIPRDRPRRGGSIVGTFQVGLKSLLGLEFQLDHIDYTKENLVHADMSPEEYSRTMNQRGESFVQMFFRMMGYGAAMQAKDPERSSDAELLAALFAKDRTLRLKRLMARQFEDMEAALGAINGPDGSTIITERNRKAFEVLDRQIEAGRRRLGIFYGAGHLPDMEQRLLGDYGLLRTEVKWLTAWSLLPSTEAASQRADDTDDAGK
jgi:hypothetical protein